MNFNLRAPWHDYRSRSIYHLTLCKAPSIPEFGRIAGNCDIPVGQPGSPFLQASPTGMAVKRALRELTGIHPALRLLQYAVMPDHLHLALQVQSELDEALGRKIAIFKARTNHYAAMKGVFREGFNDQILTSARSLDIIFRYIRENPMRLALRFRHPEYFCRRACMTIGDSQYSAYGNLMLLANPFKEQVVIHRSDSPDTRNHNRERWLHTAANGGILVSPFISPAENAIRMEAEQYEGGIILLTNKPLREREKPAGHNFDLCARGRLLILSPLDKDFPRGFGRQCCLAMNAHSERIAATTLTSAGLCQTTFS